MNGSVPGTQLAAAGDTWGIPGPDFLYLYLGTAVAAVIVVLATRHAATRGRPGDAADLDPEQAGYLAGYRARAYFTALAALRTLGLVAMVGPGKIAAVGSSPVRVSELQHAILLAAGSGARASVVQSDPRLTAPIDRIRDELRALGLLLTPAQSARCRWAATLLLAIEAVGVARLAAAIQNGHPYLNLLVVMVVVGVLGVILLAVVPVRTAAGTAALRQLIERNAHLIPAQNPSWATYGAMGVGFSVALFGAGALFAIDPAFVGAVDLPRYVGSGGSDAVYSGGDGGSSSGGGDSGGGSGCGGGSSCGGGGCGG